MEVKINREIRDYQESIFFGLNLRQLIFSILAIAVAVGVYRFYVYMQFFFKCLLHVRDHSENSYRTGNGALVGEYVVRFG